MFTSMLEGKSFLAVDDIFVAILESLMFIVDIFTLDPSIWSSSSRAVEAACFLVFVFIAIL